MTSHSPQALGEIVQSHRSFAGRSHRLVRDLGPAATATVL